MKRVIELNDEEADVIEEALRNYRCNLMALDHKDRARRNRIAHDLISKVRTA